MTTSYFDSLINQLCHVRLGPPSVRSLRRMTPCANSWPSNSSIAPASQGASLVSQCLRRCLNTRQVTRNCKNWICCTRAFSHSSTAHQNNTKSAGSRRVAIPTFTKPRRGQRYGKRLARSVIVSTGTASGKTECFLIPILDALVREYNARQK